MNLQVKSIDSFQCKEWLIYKHYAKRIPSISFAFGLFDNTILIGICTYGMPCRFYNNGGQVFDNKLDVYTLELNRLCVNDGLPKKNSLSYFISQTFNLLPKPMCLVSYADPNNFHTGFIYQATNWIYTGVGEIGGKSHDFILGDKYIHGRNAESVVRNILKDKYDSSVTFYENFERIGGEIKSQVGKHRYFQFLGSKTIKQNMRKKLKYDVLPYPKADNQRYDTSYKPTVQLQLL